MNTSLKQELTNKLEKEKSKFLRMFAEFENYKKRIQKERIDLFKTAHKNVMITLIPVLDDFERGISEIKKSKNDDIIRGVELIQDKLLRILKENGLKEIQVKKGDSFNTDYHEAITQTLSPSEELKGRIIEIVESGYSLHNKVIRHAKVIVGK